MKIVLVEWNDAATGNLWTRRDIPQVVDPIVSVGILVREGSEEIEIDPNIGKEFKLHDIAIPKGSIKRMRRLRL